MAYVSVDVDLDEIDSDDLVNEIVRRIKSSHYNCISDQNKKKLQEALPLNTTDDGIKINTLDDKMKVCHFASVMSKYTIIEIEEKLP